MMKVTIIQYLLLLLILSPDSNVESSNMASLESGVGYFYLDTAGSRMFPECRSAAKQRAQPIPEPHYLQRVRIKSSQVTGTSLAQLQRFTCALALPREEPPLPCLRATAARRPAWRRDRDGRVRADENTNHKGK